MEEKGLLVKFQAACGRVNLDNDIVFFFFHIDNNKRNWSNLSQRI